MSEPRYRLIQGDCLEVLKTLGDASIDAIVTDPPYGWKFMGRKWDYSVPSVALWAEALRVLKRGGTCSPSGGRAPITGSW
jgi:predicted methyltransferase